MLGEGSTIEKILLITGTLIFSISLIVSPFALIEPDIEKKDDDNK